MAMTHDQKTMWLADSYAEQMLVVCKQALRGVEGFNTPEAVIAREKRSALLQHISILKPDCRLCAHFLPAMTFSGLCHQPKPILETATLCINHNQFKYAEMKQLCEVTK